MQDELEAEGTTVQLQILGVNGAGFEAGNEAVCAGRDLPWLQDTVDAAVWASWAVTYRDVVILNPAGQKVAVYNLTTNDLGQPDKFAELKALLQGVANAP